MSIQLIRSQIRKYVPLALRTELNPGGIKGDKLVLRRLRHSALGFTTETAEFFTGLDRVNTLEECGDLAWYLAVAADLVWQKNLTLKLAEGPLRIMPDTTIELQQTANAGHLVRLSGELCDYVKRWEFYKKEPDWHQVGFTVSCAWMAVHKAVSLHGGDFEQVLGANVAKLRTRYPDRFTCELAVKRNVKQERKVLEQHMKKAA